MYIRHFKVELLFFFWGGGGRGGESDLDSYAYLKKNPGYTPEMAISYELDQGIRWSF